MKAIKLDGFRKGLNYVSNQSITKPSQKQNFLIKVHYASINPSDLGFVAGVYGRPNYTKNLKFPIIPGFEGSGIIVDTFDNKDKLTQSLIGKKVSFCSNYEKSEYYYDELIIKFHRKLVTIYINY